MVNGDAHRDDRSATQRTTTLRVGPSLRIQDVEVSYRMLQQSLNGVTSIGIDLSSLIDIDTAGVQLLIAYGREAARLGIDVQFFGETTAFIEALTLLGLRWTTPTRPRPSGSAGL
jgi:ABC-type transporter Mla MlaB component